jgi:spermidine synthase
MKNKSISNITQFFVPQTIKKFKSRHNKKIELVKFSNSLRLDMGGLAQSGEVIERIWKKAFHNLLPKKFSPKKVLILGFGAGSAAKLVHKKWSNAKITGVEIDPVVIEIAQKYFKIKKLPVIIHNIDAHGYVNGLKKKFDLTLLDCYQGDQFPKKLESHIFLKKLLKHTDNLLINRLFWGQYQEPTLEFRDHLTKYFNINTTRTTSSYLLSLKPKSKI